MSSRQQMPPEAKQIVDGAMHREEALRLSRRFEAAHVTLSLSSRLTRDLGGVV